MKAMRALRTFTSLQPQKKCLRQALLLRFYSAEPQPDLPKGAATDSSDADFNDSVFDSTHYELPDAGSGQPTWDDKYRAIADRRIFGKETEKSNLRVVDKDDRRSRELAKALLQYALARADDEEEQDEVGVVKEEDQKSLSVGIIGPPNAGKSSLTNYLVGTKVAAVSRKTNTTTHDVLGVMRKGDTQISLFDTPGISLNKKVRSYKTDINVRAQSVMNVIDLYDVLIVMFDVERHLTRPDKRVISLIEHIGEQVHPKQKRVLCMNKVDLVEKKKQLLKVSDQFKDLPGYERYFMISGLKGAGVNDLTNYLMEQAVKRPWDEDSLSMDEEVMKSISLEVVRERLLDHVHKEIPYTVEHRLTDWKELRDGSLKIEHHLITHKESQRKILVGAKGSKIGKIGMEANEELRTIFGRNVHLILKVRVEK